MPEDINDPKTFPTIIGFPPLEGETMVQYLDRVRPLLDQKVIQNKRRTQTQTRFLWLLLALFGLLIVLGMANLWRMYG